MQFWADGCALAESVYDFTDDESLDWPMSVMSQGDIPITAAHMEVAESYPRTFGSIFGNYR